ncbi:MAG: threonine-phosphate decarboxylase [Hyphomicrobiales bacterium]|nr:MAG: threonine-phosphate decarboxylase [Hyphomicrobiales bacterium]
MDISFPSHGGNLGEAARRFGIAPNAWLDLSTGVNPLAYPVPDIDAALWRRLPEHELIADLEQAALKAYGAGARAAALASAGSAALIHLLPFMAGGRRVHIAGPTFAEHPAAWTHAGHEVHMVRGLDDAGADVMVVVNPNNPGAERYRPDELNELAGALHRRGGLLVVDEAFADPHPELSVAAAAGMPGLVVLRSFGKFFGLSGLRLGFALAAPEMIAALRALAGPWPVSGPAARIGAAALGDRAWIEASRARLGGDAIRMRQLVEQAGLTVAGSCALFTLLELPDAGALHLALARQGVWSRIFPDQPRRLRLGMPGREADWQRLKAALGAAVSR